MAKASHNPKSVSRLTLEDIVGPPIPDLKADNKPWQQLQKMTGLDKIKQEFAQMIDYAQRKKESERLGIEMPRTFSLHRLFLGPPGVGKTTVARLYGQLILELGVHVHKEPTMVDPSHLIGAYVGHSERNTSKYLSKAKGGVLVIDEAHMLYTSRANGENCSDVFRRAILDKIVAEVTADADEDRCVILVGHPDRMEDMFLHSIPGLQRRFPKESAMIFEAFTADQLLQIFRAKMDVEKIQATDDALKVAEQVLVRMRINPQFGNAGDVENLLATARRRHLANNEHPSFWANSSAKALELEPQDIDPRWNRLLSADGSRAAMFEKFVGFDSITDKFEQYKNRVVGMERRGVDPRPKMPWNFVFEGPPGTGKTSTARKLGQLYYDLCLLSTDEVIECSVGELLDMTGLKVTNMLEKSLGKVLFIDEAYRLVGTTAGELITGELVDAVTKTRYARNLVIVLAGYTKDMDMLLSANPGLRSRFPEHILFPLLSVEACKELLEKELRREGMFIEDHMGGGSCGVVREFRRLSRTPGWANGRDVETLGRAIVNAVFAEVGKASSDGEASDTVMVSRREVDKQMRLMYEDRTRDGQETKSTTPGQARWGDWQAE
ncbi:P-loop containing nucleoside triphosphate hydrolase protein [Plectosphaerella plurivora]|uniref:P-loop containing nucleoside triphosphate hydrolase protein n=1 Tax=Plectosphaerella plurivora TaxID=936078 RepID=A0A9P8VJH6_9PEZI|nr:P-loop containing nucleoside triphosphate hydrolase protein [Plectosphaerella plurivora]